MGCDPDLVSLRLYRRVRRCAAIASHDGRFRGRTQDAGFMAWVVGRGAVVQRCRSCCGSANLQIVVRWCSFRLVGSWPDCTATKEIVGLGQYNLLGSLLGLPEAAFCAY